MLVFSPSIPKPQSSPKPPLQKGVLRTVADTNLWRDEVV